MKRVGLLGLTFSNPNKGCMALAFSFLNILKEVQQSYSDLDIVIFSDMEYELTHVRVILQSIRFVFYRFKNPKSIIGMNSELRKCDLVFDFTEGDSFSDIYGLKRMVKVSLTKEFILMNNVPLVLCPQTYGPYRSNVSKALAKNVFRRAKYICSRDEKSSKVVYDLNHIMVDTYTDVAFGLPSECKTYIGNSERKKIGINISALLWNGGYNGKNQFGLSVDYKMYIEKIIAYLEQCEEYDIYLIPHVYSESMDEIENDYLACLQIKDRFTNCSIPKLYDLPMEMKGYISQMDYFLGARMHATIAAFSSGVVTIPFSYSRKFEGLYESLEYPFVIHGNSSNTDKAIEDTVRFIKNESELVNRQLIAMKKVNSKLDEFKKKVTSLIYE